MLESGCFGVESGLGSRSERKVQAMGLDGQYRGV